MASESSSTASFPLSGFVLVLIQFDVCEEIRLDQIQPGVTSRTVRQPSTKQAAPAYVRYERPPVVELWEVDFASRVEPIVRRTLERSAGALVKPYERWLSEDYFIFHVREVAGSPTAAELVAAQRLRIAQVVRGDRLILSEGECAEVLNSQISYYAADLTVIGWNAAFLYDSSLGAQTAIQLLEYANSQLLEFRHYDELLTGILDNVYDLLGEKKGMLARYRLARSATSLQTVLLDIGELTEHADNAIKFLSDMFAARLYRLAAAKVGVPDYKNLVAEKLRTAEALHQDMLEQFNQSRGFLLEVTVVLILLIELFFAFRGKG